MSSSPRCSGCISNRTQSLVRHFFKSMGLRLYNHPIRFISLGVLLIFLCSAVGSVYYVQICQNDEIKCFENRSFYLWIPSHSTVWSQYMEIIDTFGTYPTVLSMWLTANNESILTPTNMNVAFEIMDTINNISLHNHNEGDYVYTDLCTRSSPNQPHCDSTAESFFTVFFQNDESLWNDMDTTLQIINGPDAPTAVYLGGLEYAEDSQSHLTRIIGAKSLRLMYSLRGSTDNAVSCPFIHSVFIPF